MADSNITGKSSTPNSRKKNPAVDRVAANQAKIDAAAKLRELRTSSPDEYKAQMDNVKGRLKASADKAAAYRETNPAAKAKFDAAQAARADKNAARKQAAADKKAALKTNAAPVSDDAGSARARVKARAEIGYQKYALNNAGASREDYNKYAAARVREMATRARAKKAANFLKMSGSQQMTDVNPNA
jgi:hypothetical protein